MDTFFIIFGKDKGLKGGNRACLSYCFRSYSLSQWLCHKESCPQCRAPCKKKKILKLFMPEGNYTADDDESLSSLTPEQLKVRRIL